VVHPVILETLAPLATRQQHWPDEAACAAVAQALARQAALRGACIELHGPLGAGKTTFARHLLRALGVTGRIKSPSYAIVEPHALSPSAAHPASPEPGAWHFDFYRFDDPREWEDAGFRELFASPGLKLVEWADKARGLLPVPDLSLWLTPQADEGREARWHAGTPLGIALLNEAFP
jgi:tRNA threonylcarbamoyladenosine biosynthesis protein TsaE